MFHYSFTN